MDFSRIFEERKEDVRWNTSYPLSPRDWEKYRVHEPLSFSGEEYLSFYIHIPFCKQLCSFCEYSKMICPDESYQNKYLSVLEKDIAEFKSVQNNHFNLKGFDIGGGTPTSLSDSCFNRLMEIYDETVDGLVLSEDFEPSIEATFNTLNEQKVRRMVQSNILRLSLGVQTSDCRVLQTHHRERNELAKMLSTLEYAWASGITKINIDLMYGLSWQDENTIKNDLKVIASMNPEQVTLYELRPNQIGFSSVFSKECLYSQYLLYFKGLTDLGYHGRVGQNTFSKCPSDDGVSSYLRSRMLGAVSYKGFGLSAQSMSRAGIAYNYGKHFGLSKKDIEAESYGEEFVYRLPAEELCAKYLAIAAYAGRFSISKLSALLGADAESFYKEQLLFCESEELLAREGDEVFVTSKGFKYYGAVFSLFHSGTVQNIL